jgi:hypothetical protein
MERCIHRRPGRIWCLLVRRKKHSIFSVVDADSELLQNLLGRLGGLRILGDDVVDGPSRWTFVAGGFQRPCEGRRARRGAPGGPVEMEGKKSCHLLRRQAWDGVDPGPSRRRGLAGFAWTAAEGCAEPLAEELSPLAGAPAGAADLAFGADGVADDRAGADGAADGGWGGGWGAGLGDGDADGVAGIGAGGRGLLGVVDAVGRGTAPGVRDSSAG